LEFIEGDREINLFYERFHLVVRKVSLFEKVKPFNKDPVGISVESKNSRSTATALQAESLPQQRKIHKPDFSITL
jgi:hypothetical protein